MNKTQVYDLPTRLFHWFFAATFLGAFFIAKTMDDDSALYPYHMMLGLIMVLVVLLRVYWGLFGSRYAKFSSFNLSPTSLISYFKDLFTSKTAKSLGHNAASSWSALAMMIFAIGLGVTGIMMAQDIQKDFFEDIHELLGNAFIIVVIAHVAGVVLHMIQHRDELGLSMIHGKKVSVAGGAGIEKSYAGTALVFLALVGAFVFYLNKNYDPTNRTLNLFGTTLQLGENEGDDASEKSNEAAEDSDGDDD
ncbi:MAG: cytochrome b/b6 domain-containing protein [Bdellovibrionales bacterium]